mgnify:CR=1 FL=1
MNNDFLPWVEKYRPKKLDQIIYQDDVINMLKNISTTGALPHLLFYGPAGTGKTESVKALGQAFGRQVLVFNCDEGIDFKSMGR